MCGSPDSSPYLKPNPKPQNLKTPNPHLFSHQTSFLSPNLKTMSSSPNPTSDATLLMKHSSSGSSSAALETSEVSKPGGGDSKSSSSSSSSGTSRASSVKSEEEFESGGEEDFEMAMEESFVANPELEGGSCEFVPVFDKPVEGSSSFLVPDVSKEVSNVVEPSLKVSGISDVGIVEGAGKNLEVVSKDNNVVEVKESGGDLEKFGNDVLDIEDEETRSLDKLASLEEVVTKSLVPDEDAVEVNREAVNDEKTSVETIEVKEEDVQNKGEDLDSEKTLAKAMNVKEEVFEENSVEVLNDEKSLVDVEKSTNDLDANKNVLVENPNLEEISKALDQGKRDNEVKEEVFEDIINEDLDDEKISVDVDALAGNKVEVLEEKKIEVPDTENSFIDVEDNGVSIGAPKTDNTSANPQPDNNIKTEVQAEDDTEVNDLVLKEKSEALDGSVQLKENGSAVKEVELPMEKSAIPVNENNHASPVNEETIEFTSTHSDQDVSLVKKNLLDKDTIVKGYEDKSSETEHLKCVAKSNAGMDNFCEQPAIIEETSKESSINSLVNIQPETMSIDREPESDVKDFDKDENKNNGDVESVLLDSVFNTEKSEPESGAADESGAEVSIERTKLIADGAVSVFTDEVNSMDKDQVEDDSEIAFFKEPIDLAQSDYEEDGSVSNDDFERMIYNSSGTAEQIMKELELEQDSGINYLSGSESSGEHSQRIDGQIMETDEEVDTDEENGGAELFDSAALAALLKAATGARSDGQNVTITNADGSKLFSVERPAGLGPLKPAPRPNRANLVTPSNSIAGEKLENNLSDDDKKKIKKLQLIRVKFLRLINRLGFSAEDSLAAQVLYRISVAGRNIGSQAFSLEAAKQTAVELEAEEPDKLDFSLSILVLGKTGVGKSATINSMFGEEKVKIDAFEPATLKVNEITGTVGGVKLRVYDTPGLRSSLMEQAFNRKILASVKKFMKKSPVDIVLYVDRLDAQTRDLNDLPLLRTITATLGSSIWQTAIVTFTHAASAPPDGQSGQPLGYEAFVAQRSHVVQQSIGQSVGDLRTLNPSLMNPVSLVENHPSCRKNRDGQRILPNGQSWRSQLSLLCYSIKILAEVNSLSKRQDPFDHRKLFGFRVRAPPLPYLLSSLLQTRPHPKLQNEQGGDVDSDLDLDDISDTEKEDEDEYDQLPPFKPLRKSQIAKLSKEQRKAYFEEYDYRVKLLQKKQLREELNRMREMKRIGKDGVNDNSYLGDDADNGAPAAVPVPLPDMALQPSFDGDNPAYRYRFLEPTSQLLTRPVLDTHGWDHDCGYDGVSIEDSFAIVSWFPAGVAVQITKDKKEFNLHLDSSVAAKHGENGSTLAGFDIQNIGKQLAYIVRGETKFKNLKKNNVTGGVSVTFLGENVATGFKIEDKVSVGKCLTLVGSTGTIRSKGDVAYGANLEARIKEKDFPIGQDQSTLGLSLMKWRGDLAIGTNFQSQVSLGRSSKVSVRIGLNNKMSGQITVKTSSSEQLQLALVGILPIAISIYRRIWPSDREDYSIY